MTGSLWLIATGSLTVTIAGDVTRQQPSMLRLRVQLGEPTPKNSNDAFAGAVIQERRRDVPQKETVPRNRLSVAGFDEVGERAGVRVCPSPKQALRCLEPVVGIRGPAELVREAIGCERLQLDAEGYDVERRDPRPSTNDSMKAGIARDRPRDRSGSIHGSRVTADRDGCFLRVRRAARAVIISPNAPSDKPRDCAVWAR